MALTKRRRVLPRISLLALFLVGLAPAVIVAVPRAAAAATRATSDRPDAVSGYQVHLMYVLPSDGTDRGLDISGSIATSAGAWNKWLAGQTGGPKFRIDKYRTSTGALKSDITFYRLSHTDAEIASSGAFVRTRIDEELSAAGFNCSNKLYAVYYDGSSTFSCGGGAWPPELIGHVAAIYLKGTPPNTPACSTNQLAPSTSSPGYLEFAILHEIMHTIGIVATCALHDIDRGHVFDSSNDPMWAGKAPWVLPPRLDIGRDDYYKAGIPGCVDLAKSVFLTPTPSGAQVPPGWSTG